MRIRSCGDTALLVELADLDEVVGWHAALSAAQPPGVTELVPAARTVLVHFDPRRTDPAALAERLRGIRPTTVDDPAAGAAATVEIPVVYDGADLADVAERTGLPVDEVVNRHGAGKYVVAFCGFAPGFGYLTGLDPALRMPRLDTPRTSVPAGSVAIADEFAAVYPSASPGGWRLLGHTDLAVWNVDRDPPALLRPGTRVRFRTANGAG